MAVLRVKEALERRRAAAGSRPRADASSMRRKRPADTLADHDPLTSNTLADHDPLTSGRGGGKGEGNGPTVRWRSNGPWAWSTGARSTGAGPGPVGPPPPPGQAPHGSVDELAATSVRALVRAVCARPDPGWAFLHALAARRYSGGAEHSDTRSGPGPQDRLADGKGQGGSFGEAEAAAAAAAALVDPDLAFAPPPSPNLTHTHTLPPFPSLSSLLSSLLSSPSSLQLSLSPSLRPPLSRILALSHTLFWGGS